jgi:phosphatidate cytidylyltransferase
MLRYRFQSSLVLIPLIVILTWLGGWWFLALVVTTLAVAIYEYTLMARQGGAEPSAAWIYAFSGGVLFAARAQPEWVWGVTVAFVMGSMVWALVRFEGGAAGAVTDWAFTLLGGLYLGWLAAFFIFVRDMKFTLDGQVVDSGLTITVMALAVTWLTDVGAYTVGRLLGRHKMSKRISPNKTWEGYLGGLAGAILMSALWLPLAAWIKFPPVPGLMLWHCMGLGCLIGGLVPLGDFGESMLKRWANVKDSGHVIPGHGGMLDRMDTLLWAAVITYAYLSWAI